MQKNSFVAKTTLNKVADLQACNFIKKRPQCKFFPMKIAKLLKKPFYRTPVEATYVTKLDEKKKKDGYTTNIFVET